MSAPITDLAVARTFVTAGNATVTFVSKATGQRFTYRIRAPKVQKGRDPVHFVDLLSGPNNGADYSALGMIVAGQDFRLNTRPDARIGADAPSAKAFAWAWRKLTAGEIPASLEIWHEGRCGRCGRKLTVPSSLASGLGPECAGKA
jgi:hypothetical protein